MLYLSNYNNLHILYVLILDFKWHVSFILNRINIEIGKVVEYLNYYCLGQSAASSVNSSFDNFVKTVGLHGTKF